MPTIALVDDERNILTSVSLSLEAEGYRIQTYTDGASALDGLKANPPDLAIFDIKMPRMDGMELLNRIRWSNASRRSSAVRTPRMGSSPRKAKPRFWSAAASRWIRSATPALGTIPR